MSARTTHGSPGHGAQLRRPPAWQGWKADRGGCRKGVAYVAGSSRSTFTEKLSRIRLYSHASSPHPQPQLPAEPRTGRAWHSAQRTAR